MAFSGEQHNKTITKAQPKTAADLSIFAPEPHVHQDTLGDISADPPTSLGTDEVFRPPSA